MSVVLALHDNPSASCGQGDNVCAQVPGGTGDLHRCEAVAFQELGDALLELPTGVSGGTSAWFCPGQPVRGKFSSHPPHPRLVRFTRLSIS
ncbi:hypothetical protein [Streptomyces sp. NPDC046805]|uniref:hypothetical protein n=1 Tax=Streptomyces sp. NPDC046805 TaxID=3155134 RepID=UPI0033F77354